MTYPSPHPVLLAEKARDADRDGSCSLCEWPILRGQRIARLPGSTQWAHTGCLGKPLRPQASR